MAHEYSRSFSPEILEKVARLELRARTIAEGLLTGQHKSRKRGFNVEFLEHKQYYTGDDLRHVDWKVYGRRDKYYVKQYEEETNLQAYIVLDASGSMNYGGSGIDGPKLEHARVLAAALGYLLLKQGDSVGFFGPCGRETLAPLSGRGRLHRLLGAMQNLKKDGRADLADSLASLGDRLKRKSIILVFTDLLEEPEPVRESLKVLRSRGGDVALFHILDRNELEFPFSKASRFIDPETGNTLTADPAAVKSAYTRELDSFINSYREFCGRVDIDYTLAPVSKSPEETILEFLQKRERSKRRR